MFSTCKVFPSFSLSQCPALQFLPSLFLAIFQNHLLVNYCSSCSRIVIAEKLSILVECWWLLIETLRPLHSLIFVVAQLTSAQVEETPLLLNVKSVLFQQCSVLYNVFHFSSKTLSINLCHIQWNVSQAMKPSFIVFHKIHYINTYISKVFKW